jgi:hypothetical protein
VVEHKHFLLLLDGYKKKEEKDTDFSGTDLIEIIDQNKHEDLSLFSLIFTFLSSHAII